MNDVFSINHEAHFLNHPLKVMMYVYCGNAMIPAKASGIPISSINFLLKSQLDGFVYNLLRL